MCGGVWNYASGVTAVAGMSASSRADLDSLHVNTSFLAFQYLTFCSTEHGINPLCGEGWGLRHEES